MKYLNKSPFTDCSRKLIGKKYLIRTIVPLNLEKTLSVLLPDLTDAIPCFQTSFALFPSAVILFSSFFPTSELLWPQLADKALLTAVREARFLFSCKTGGLVS